MELKVIDYRLSNLAASGAKFNNEAQALGIAIMEHANDPLAGRGDCTRAARLVRILPAKVRPQMIAWFAAFSPINVTVGKLAGEDKARYHKDTSPHYNPFNIEGARANPWYEYAKERKETKALTFTDYSNKLLASLDNDMKKLEAGDNKFDAVDRTEIMYYIAVIRKAMSEYRAAKVVEGEIENPLQLVA